MEAAMIVNRSHDPLVIRIMLEKFWKAIAEDGLSLDDAVIDTENIYWLLIKEGDQILGMFTLIPLNEVTLDGHAHVLPEHRDKAKEIGLMSIKWLLDNVDQKYQKLNTQVPTIYPNVYHYTLKIGLKDEGLNRLSYRKNGELHDQHMVGATRDELIKFIEG